MQEGLAAEHGSELFGHTLPYLLDGGAVADEGSRHLETLWWDIANGGLDVVGDPLRMNERVFVSCVWIAVVPFRCLGDQEAEHKRASALSDCTPKGVPKQRAPRWGRLGLVPSFSPSTPTLPPIVGNFYNSAMCCLQCLDQKTRKKGGSTPRFSVKL